MVLERLKYCTVVKVMRGFGDIESTTNILMNMCNIKKTKTGDIAQTIKKLRRIDEKNNYSNDSTDWIHQESFPWSA